MLNFVRRGRTAALQALSCCDSWSQVCTSTGRASVHDDRTRDRAHVAGFRC